MRTIALITALLLLLANSMVAHPGSGLIVDRQGNVYFVDTGSGIWKIDREGKLTRIAGPAYHWMAIDIDKRLADVTLPYFAMGNATVTRSGDTPQILLSSDFPIAVGHDGSLFYPWLGNEKRVWLFRLTPTGTTTVLTTLPEKTRGGELRWLNGLATTRDGSVYYTDDNGIQKVSSKGELTTVVSNVVLAGCDPFPGLEESAGVYFRGLDIDSKGNIYVAASGCRSVLKVAKDGSWQIILRSEAPWSPTSVATFESDVYVLEYLHTPGDNRKEWLPRVRRISADGSVTVVAAIKR